MGRKYAYRKLLPWVLPVGLLQANLGSTEHHKNNDGPSGRKQNGAAARGLESLRQELDDNGSYDAKETLRFYYEISLECSISYQ